MLQDLWFGARAFLRNPLLTVVAVLTLGLGVGGASAVFSVVEAVLLRPLPFRDPDRLVRIWELTREGSRFSFSEPNFLDLRAESRALEHVAAYADPIAGVVLAEGGEPQRLGITPASASLMDVLGIAPAHGRMFSAAEDRPGAPERLLVLSDRTWRERFGAASGLIGATVRLDGMPAIVTGIMPPGFDFPGKSDAWTPLRASALSERDNKALAVVGRVAAGVTMAQAQEDLRQFGRRLSDAHQGSNGGWSMDAALFSDWIVGPRYREAIWILFGAVGVLLLLACANVANLLLASGSSRGAEMQLRSALGASRLRLIRQLLTEASLLALLGTIVGILAASWSLDIVRALGGDRVPRLDGLKVHAPVLLFAAVAGTASCLMFGLLPALQGSRVDLRSAGHAFRYASGSRRLRNSLVVIEVALALLLLVSAGLLGSSFTRLMHVDPGFETEGALAVPIELSAERHSPEQRAALVAQLIERAQALPGVEAAGATSTNPFRQFGFSNSVRPADRAAEAPAGGMVRTGWRSVTPGFFEAMKIPVISGRTFDRRDRQDGERAVVLSERLARQLWPDGTAVGKRIYWGGNDGPTRTVIGVVGDIQDVQLEAEARPMLYVAHQQVEMPGMTMIVRTPGSAAALAAPLRDLVRQIDPTLPAPTVQDIESGRAVSVAGPRFNLWLLGTFAAIAVVLAATGVYGMLAFTVVQRRREIAVRLALGADPTDIRRLVLRSGLRLAIAGVAAGAGLALAVTRVLSSMLFGVEPTDPLTFAAAALTLLAIAALACYLPARHASHLEPGLVLRD